jgi:hypothetical protein
MTRMRGTGREATGAVMVAPVGVEEGTASRPATPDRRLDRGDPRGGGAPGSRGPGRGFRSRGRRNSWASRQAALKSVPERAMGRTPHPIVADFVEALGQPRLEEAADDLSGGPGHGPPALILGLRLAEADVAVRDREHTAIAPCEAVTRPARGVQDLLGPLPRRCAIDHPALGPDRCGQRSVGAFVTPQLEAQAAQQRRAGMGGGPVGRAGGPPLGPVGGDPTGGHQTVHMRGIDAGPSPGVEDAAPAAEPPDVMGGGGERDERLGRGAEPDVIQVLLVAAAQLPQCLGRGEDGMTRGDW